MAAWRRAIEVSLGDEHMAKLRSPSFFAVSRALGLHHQTVQRCVERAVVEGSMAALDDRPRPGREPLTIYQRVLPQRSCVSGSVVSESHRVRQQRKGESVEYAVSGNSSG